MTKFGSRATLHVRMLDLKFIRDHHDLVVGKMKLRSVQHDLGGLLSLDMRHRKALAQVEEMRHTRNVKSEEIASLKKSKKSADSLMASMKLLSDQVKSLEGEIRDLEREIKKALLLLPNLVDDSVPQGKDQRDNVEIRRWGRPPKFDFDPKPHWEVGEHLGILDFERAARMTGARFVLYQGLGARLERALINFMLDLHVQEQGYQEVMPPTIVNQESMVVTGQLPKFEDDLFRIQGEDLYLIPTGEVPLTNIHRDETIPEDSLPRSYVSYTPCFRREAGSYGKDTRGLIRQHQFNKVELVRFARPEDSYDWLERLVCDAEEVLKRLDLHYRVVVLCTGDIGFSAAKTYDLEVWLPGLKTFKEISSCSNFEAFQSRRGNVRFRRREGRKTEFLHTLNGSGLAVGRTVLAILENYQQNDGSVTVPEALRPYMGGVEKISME